MSAPTTSSRFLFLYERFDRPARTVADDPRAGWEHLEVPPGPCILTVTRGGAPRILGALPRAQGATSLLLEAVRHRGQDRLLVVRMAGAFPRLNGLLGPKIAFLGVGDQLHPGRGPLLHLSQEVPSRVQTPDEEHLGQECPICRVPFSAGSRVYQCPCGQPMHDETEETAEGEPLECALLTSTCCHCGAQVLRDGGLSYMPEG